LITISRSLARQLRSMFRRALNLTPKGQECPVTFDAGPDGLTVLARNHETAVEYHRPGNYRPARPTLPFNFLADCEGRKDEPVTIEIDGAGHIVANWQDGNVPRTVTYKRAESAIKDPFPRMLDNYAINHPGLRKSKPMPLTLNVGISKKIGQPDFGSLGASCNVQVELPSNVIFDDLEAFQRQVQQAYSACTQTVTKELSRHQQDGGTSRQYRPTASNGNGRYNRNGNGSQSRNILVI
jgi:hypothetical protein